MALLLLVGYATASSQVDFGGAVDAMAQVAVVPDGLWSAGGLRQAEGDLRWRAGVITTWLELDVTAVYLNEAARQGDLGDAAPWAVVVAPERVTVGVDAGSVGLDAGLALAPWRVEAPDGWDNALVTWSGIEALTPAEVLGATLRLQGDQGQALLVAGIDVGDGPVWAQGFGGTGWANDPTSPPARYGAAVVAGLRGVLAGERWEVGAGVYGWPTLGSGALEAGGRVDLGALSLQGEGVLAYGGGSGVTAQVELYPSGALGAVARGSWIGGVAGGALGVMLRPSDRVVAKVEAGHASQPYAAVELAVYSRWPPEG